MIQKVQKYHQHKLYKPKVTISNVPKKMFLLSGRSWELLRKKLQKLFSDKLTPCNSKIVFTSSVRVKSFSPLRISYPRCYFQDLFRSISVVAAMLPIKEIPNAILKSEFVNI